MLLNHELSTLAIATGGLAPKVAATGAQSWAFTSAGVRPQVLVGGFMRRPWSWSTIPERSSACAGGRRNVGGSERNVPPTLERIVGSINAIESMISISRDHAATSKRGVTANGDALVQPV